jgi:Fe-S-cluster-containing hydrogenase component 2
MRLKVDPPKCSGCHLCEIVCSLFHINLINIEKSAIRIKKDDLDTSMNTPVLCRQCKEMKCLDGEEAIKDKEKNRYLWNRVRAERCPFEALSVVGDIAYHCDLCGGDPQCIKVCTPRAISLTR